MQTTVKEVFESDNWIITKILQGHAGMVRVDAKRRYREADKPTFFSEWCGKQYADKLSRENYGKMVNDFACYEY